MYEMLFGVSEYTSDRVTYLECELAKTDASLITDSTLFLYMKILHTDNYEFIQYVESSKHLQEIKESGDLTELTGDKWA